MRPTPKVLIQVRPHTKARLLTADEAIKAGDWCNWNGPRGDAWTRVTAGSVMVGSTPARESVPFAREEDQS